MRQVGNACFNTFYEFVRDDYRQRLAEKNVREKDFDIDNFLNVLEPYYRGGEYDYLLNSDKELDLLHKRFIVFELDNIKDHKILIPDNDYHHHGSLYQQDAQVKGNKEVNLDRGSVESDCKCEHGGLHKIFVQDRPKVFRGSDCSHARGRGYYFFPYREREYHQ